MAPSIADLQREIKNLKRTRAVGWRQFYQLREFVNEILQQTRIDGPLIPIIRRMILNLEPNHRQCSICIDVISNGDISFVYNCGHIFHNECFSEWLSQGNICPLCRGISDHAIV